MDLLRQLAEAVVGRARIPVAVSLEPRPQISPEVTVTFYRIAQEALNNVTKHSGASQARIFLGQGPDGCPAVRMVVEDDGAGFELPAVQAGHFGLSIMAERAEAIGALLEVSSSKGDGTRVAVSWTPSGRELTSR